MLMKVNRKDFYDKDQIVYSNKNKKPRSTKAYQFYNKIDMQPKQFYQIKSMVKNDDKLHQLVMAANNPASDRMPQGKSLFTNFYKLRAGHIMNFFLLLQQYNKLVYDKPELTLTLDEVFHMV
jgi:hypothetical protein